jgi:hypothetical protein
VSSFCGWGTWGRVEPLPKRSCGRIGCGTLGSFCCARNYIIIKGLRGWSRGAEGDPKPRGVGFEESAYHTCALCECSPGIRLAGSLREGSSMPRVTVVIAKPNTSTRQTAGELPAGVSGHAALIVRRPRCGEGFASPPLITLRRRRCTPRDSRRPECAIRHHRPGASCSSCPP